MLCWSALALQNLSTRFSRVKGGTEGVGSSIEEQSLLLSEFRYRRGNEGIKRSNPRSTHEASSRGAESNWAEPTGIDPSVAPGTHPLPKRFSGRDVLWSTWNALPLPQLEMIRSPRPLTIRCLCLCLAILQLSLILARRSRPPHGQPCSSGSSRGSRSVTSHMIMACGMRRSGVYCGPLVAAKWYV